MLLLKLLKSASFAAFLASVSDSALSTRLFNEPGSIFGGLPEGPERNTDWLRAAAEKTKEDDIPGGGGGNDDNLPNVVDIIVGPENSDDDDTIAEPEEGGVEDDIPGGRGGMTTIPR